MDFFRYLVRFFYRIRWYLVVIPAIALVVAIFATRNMEKQYDVKTTVYTGIISGYNLDTGSGISTSLGDPRTNMNDLLNIITTDKTLRKVSLRLFARCLMYGDPSKNNNYITAEHYKMLSASVPADVKALINKQDEGQTVANLLAYERPTENNYIYGLLNYGHPWFSIQALAQNLRVGQVSNSDIIEIGYSANDPGVAYNTLDILNEEFIDQYQEIRFGETNNVIKFFEGEVARLYKILCGSEDELIKYNVSKGIINYGEQTKMVANMDADHKRKDIGLLMDYATTKSLVDFLEVKLGDKARIIRSNNDFLNELNNISKLKQRVSNLELMNEDGNNETNDALTKARRELVNAERHIKTVAQDISAATTSTNGVNSKDLVNRWLDQVILQNKTKAELEAMNIERGRLDKDFLFYSPIGATISRKERHIGFVEANYMQMLSALNSARLRQKNLQMTTATLKVLNPPLFPLSAHPTNRMMILLMSVFIAFILTGVYFFIIELLDRTLRDRRRTESITDGKVIGVYPREEGMRYRRYNKLVSDMALRQLSKSLLPFFKEGQQNILSILSTEEKNGKSYIANELEEYWTSIGLQVRKVTYDEDFLAEDSKFIMAKSLKDLCPDLQESEIVIVEYPNLAEHSVAPALLNESTVNLVINRANRAWKDTDAKAYKSLLSMLEKDKHDRLFIYLTEGGRDAVEEFTGQLPPYTPLKNFLYRISQLGLTAVENEKAV